MSRNFSLDNRVWAISGDRTDPDTVTTSEANLLTVEVGHIDSQGPFSDMMNWEQHRVSEMLNAVEQGGVLDWSSKTEYHVRGLCLGDDGQIYQSRKDKNKGQPITDTSWWIEYIPTGMGDMLASVYDKDGNGIVDNSQKVNGVDTSANHTYYGKDQSGNIGFHAVPPDGDMKKSVYDTNNNGIVDKAEMVNGANSAGPKKYYGTDNDNKVGFFDLPPDGDMLKSVYDTDNSGRVDTAESVFGINSASSTAYYGKNKAGDIGFHDFISQLPETATRWPTADEAGAYEIGSTVYDSDRLSGMLASGLADPDTIAQRDAEGNGRFGTIRTAIANQNSIGESSAVAFRVNTTDDNHLRFIGSEPLKKWLKLTKSDVGLDQLNNYPISHKADETATSKTAYASEYAVGVAWDLAKKAMDISVGGGGSAYADEAGKLATARTIALAGDVTGSVNFDGSQNVSMTTSVADNSHKHQWGNLTDVPSTASRWPSWNEVTSKPSSFPPAAHTHTADDVGAVPITRKVNGHALSNDVTLAQSDIPGLTEALSNKAYWQQGILDLTHLPNDNFYVVHLFGGKNNMSYRSDFFIRGGGTSGGEQFTDTQISGFAQSSGWASVRPYLNIDYIPYSLEKSTMHSIWHGYQSFEGIVIYLRGGFSYHYGASSTVTLHESDVSLGGSLFPSGISKPMEGGSFRSLCIELINKGIGNYVTGNIQSINSVNYAEYFYSTAENQSSLGNSLTRKDYVDHKFQTKITSGTSSPTGGSDGDVYIQY